MGSFKALAWALLLLFIIIYVTGRTQETPWIQGMLNRENQGGIKRPCGEKSEGRQPERKFCGAFRPVVSMLSHADMSP